MRIVNYIIEVWARFVNLESATEINLGLKTVHYTEVMKILSCSRFNFFFPVVHRKATIAKLYGVGSAVRQGESQGTVDQYWMHVFPANERYKRGNILHDRYIQIDRQRHKSKHVHHNRRCCTGILFIYAYDICFSA